MGLPVPVLDERSYKELRDELVRRIPVYSPEWTDFNESDPGVTLVELFTFLADSLLWQIDKRQRRSAVAAALPLLSSVRQGSVSFSGRGAAFGPSPKTAIIQEVREPEEIAADLTCAECGRSLRAGETWQILFADKIARESVIYCPECAEREFEPQTAS